MKKILSALIIILGILVALLILWVGIGALVRGIAQIVFAFQIRSAAHAAG